MRALGIDIGGTNIEAGQVDDKGRILKKIIVKTESKKGKKAVVENIIKAIEKVITDDIVGIGIGAPGPLDIKKGVLGKIVNIPLDNIHIKSIIKNRFKKAVFLNNDANCFVLGEAFFGAGKSMTNIIGLTLGTGVGGGIVISKKLYIGRNNGGELGHTTINFNGLDCKCGNNGCIESHIGKKAIIRYAKGMANSPLELYELACKGDEKAKNVWEQVGKYLGIGIANFIDIFDPDVIVIGGNISRAWKFFNKTMKKEAKKRSLFKPCSIVKSKLGSRASILGAASLVFSAKNIYRK